MISLDECRRILNKPDLTDEQVETIRDSLKAFAYACVDQYLLERKAEKEKKRIQSQA